MTSKAGNTGDHGRRGSWTDLIKRKEFLLVLRLFLGVLFIYASYDKILHPDRFAVAVRAYKIIPFELSNLFALLIAWSEMAAGILLVLGVLIRQAAAAVFILLFTFIAAISYTLVRGMIVDCGCFGSGGSGHSIDVGLLVRDVLLLAAAFMVMRYDEGFLGIRPAPRRRS